MLLEQFSRARRNCQVEDTLWFRRAKCGRQAQTENRSTAASLGLFALCFRFGVVCSVFLSLAECWRFAAFQYSSWKGLRAPNRVTEELFVFFKKARLFASSSTSTAASVARSSSAHEVVVTHNVERLLLALGIQIGCHQNHHCNMVAVLEKHGNLENKQTKKKRWYGLPRMFSSDDNTVWKFSSGQHDQKKKKEYAHSDADRQTISSWCVRLCKGGVSPLQVYEAQRFLHKKPLTSERSLRVLLDFTEKLIETKMLRRSNCGCSLPPGPVSLTCGVSSIAKALHNRKRKMLKSDWRGEHHLCHRQVQEVDGELRHLVPSSFE